MQKAKMNRKVLLLTWSGAHLLFAWVAPLGAQGWMPAGSPNTSWQAIATSADGSKLVAAAIDDAIYTSTNAGATWILTSAPTNRWSGVASSADGARLVAVAESPEPLVVRSYPQFGAIYISSDSGATWIQTSAPTNGWAAVASSADGARLVALSGEVYNQTGPIYTSTDGGADWKTTSAPSNLWQSVASSADGTKLVAVAGSGPIQPLGRVYLPISGPIYHSADSGSTWTPSVGSSNVWRSVASSADGAKLAAAAYDGLIYTSMDFGGRWMASGAPSNSWTGIASSADGCVLAATAYYQRLIYISTNSGATWTSNSPGQWWTCVASSADGGRLAAAGAGAVIYTSYLARMPRLNIGRVNSHIAVSWIWPSMSFVLEQGDALDGPWTNVSTAPVLLLSNLQYEVKVPPTNNRTFFRLKQ